MLRNIVSRRAVPPRQCIAVPVIGRSFAASGALRAGSQSGKPRVFPPPPDPPAFSVSKVRAAPIAPVKTPLTTPPAPQVAPAPKKTHKFRRFLIETFLLAAGFYAVGTYLSLEYDYVNDLFTEYVPFAEQLVFFAEDQKFQQKFKNLDLSKYTSTRQTHDNDERVIIPNAGVVPKGLDLPLDDPSAIDITKPGPHTSSLVTPPTPPHTPTEQKSKALALAPYNSGKASSLPVILVKETDPLIQSTVEALNKLIIAINGSHVSDNDISTVTEKINRLSIELSSLRKQHKEELKNQSEQQTMKFQLENQNRDLEIKEALSKQQEHWSNEFLKEREEISNLYKKRLNLELQSNKENFINATNNVITASRIEQYKEFSKQINELVENERDGRLSKLNELSQNLDEISKLAVKVDDLINKSFKSSQLNLTVNKLTTAINDVEPKPLKPIINELNKINKSDSSEKHDELIDLIIENIPENILEQGILTPSQLHSRFQQLLPSLRDASLLPQDAGIAGHIGSWIFSKLLFSKKGLPLGSDFESIIARTETALQESRVIDAVEEINKLKGWPKVLARDWIIEGRKRCEIQFAESALREEAKLYGVE